MSNTRAFALHLWAFVLPLITLAYWLTAPHVWWASLLWITPVVVLVQLDNRGKIDKRQPREDIPAWPFNLQVYLLFALERMDIFPAGDIALQGAYGALRGMAARPDAVALRRAAERWQPHRSLAARLLWHHWRFLTGRPAMDDLPGA